MSSSTSIRLVLAAAAVALVAACTTSTGAPTAPGASAAAAASAATSASALTVQQQITATIDGIDAAMVAYKAGDADKAYELAGDAYLEHFEFVEPAIDPIDMMLREQIEELVRDDLRAAIKAGKPAAEVEVIATAAKAALATAATKLQ